MATTRSAITQALVETIQSMDQFSSASVFGVSSPRFLDNPPGTVYVEVVPGSQVDEEGAQGWGKGIFRVSVCIFIQMIVDREQDEITALSNGNNGLLQYIDALDTAILANTLGGTLASPFAPEGIEAPRADEEKSGWFMQQRDYSCVYAFSYPGVT